MDCPVSVFLSGQTALEYAWREATLGSIPSSGEHGTWLTYRVEGEIDRGSQSGNP